jgi:uncharacterized protein YmfQ (DUF2313 family)
MAKAVEYQQMLLSFMPLGDIWPRDPKSTLGRLCMGKAREYARLEEMLYRLLEEADPRTTSDCLKDWERVSGLPDQCSLITDTPGERRNALHAKLTACESPTPAYFVSLAAKLGFSVTITEFKPFRAGFGRAGEPAVQADWAYVFRVNAPAVTVRRFKAGNSVAGEKLSDWGNELLECAILRDAPAHTLPIFAYGG